MAFKFKTFAAVGALIGSLALVGCGQDEKDPNHIKVGVIVGAEQQVAEVAQKVAKDKYGHRNVDERPRRRTGTGPLGRRYPGHRSSAPRTGPDRQRRRCRDY